MVHCVRAMLDVNEHNVGCEDSSEANIIVSHFG